MKKGWKNQLLEGWGAEGFTFLGGRSVARGVNGPFTWSSAKYFLVNEEGNEKWLLLCCAFMFIIISLLSSCY